MGRASVKCTSVSQKDEAEDYVNIGEVGQNRDFNKNLPIREGMVTSMGQTVRS
jgi:hypothetical protein